MASEEQTRAEKSLERIVNFDVATLVRRDDLGSAFEFSKAVEPARKLVELFKRLPQSSLQNLPGQQLAEVQAAADSVFALFDQILQFDPSSSDAVTSRETIIANLVNQYQRSFNTVSPIVAYTVAQTVNLGDIADQGRALLQSIRDQSQEELNEARRASETVASVLSEVRNAAAEQGVTQQAKFFADEARLHDSVAKKWRNYSMVMTGVVLFYAIASLFFPHIGWLQADSPEALVQLSISKFLVFFVLVYALFQCVKNYNANMHNAIVNKHRQNALLTYTTLVEASDAPQVRDVVIQHAAGAIYAPGDSGYVKNEERGFGEGGLLNTAARQFSGQGQS